MAASPTCPRGHPLEPNAVLCTVCWIRVEPVDPEVEAARRRRRRRVWLPLFGASAMLIGVFVGGSLGIIDHTPAAPVAVAEPAALPATPTPLQVAAVPPPTAQPTASAAAVAVLPLAATVAAWSSDVCVPAEASSVEVAARPGATDPWEPVAAAVTLGPSASCASGEQGASITVATLPDGAGKVRVLARDDSGSEVFRARFDASS